ncbi:MAG: AAA family ATPase [Nitrosopumilus sp.]|nr:AAA family ATPase [Nitrosopumilus sp.]MDA7954993.1 AAA family ATPase [Nitrosopumilus sp.]MDA7973847.1 AAA family ATPase [Nitrosopumilus sp.]MDA7997790.1 AAA family ATPase [Nitrosopumilus sp.]
MILHLKHVAVPGSLLIIEEPEAHLHVESQIVMARYVMRMIRAGLNVLVTTHSSVMVDVMGMYMKSSMAYSKTRRSMKFAPDEYIEFDEVSAYSFKKSPGPGHDIRKIKTDTVDRIPQAGYVSALRKTYDRCMRLESELEGQ